VTTDKIESVGPRELDSNPLELTTEIFFFILSLLGPYSPLY